VVSAATAAALIEIAKSLYYKDRNYDRVLSDAAARQLPGDELAGLKAWLPQNQLNQKRLDAIAMLRAIKEAHAAAVAPTPVSYVFEHTTLWDSVEQQFGAGGGEEGSSAASPRNGIFDELRLDRALYDQLRRNAIIRALSRRTADEQGVEPTISELQDATRRFRRRMGFQAPAELEAWLRDHHLSRDQFMRLMGDEASRSRLDAAHARAIDDALADELALAEAHARLQSRADAKHATLAARGIDQPTLDHVGLSEAEVIAWFLAECGQEPADRDPNDLARQLGFVDKGDLLRAALREHCYRAWKHS